uniref:Protein kinase domain-containing protein n=2 Tax=Triticum urartu TaxID=4572 RepID=A0A8R7P3B3_TRIUA
MAMSKQWTRVRTLGRGASGAEVFLAADDPSGELFAVKSASAACAAALRREQCIMSGLRSPRVVSCIGGRGARDGSFQLFLEFAPGGSLADRVAIDGGLDERAVRGYAADVAAGLAYLHGAGMVHGDVKARNIVIGADGRAKLADFGCARDAGADVPIIGGTPAFMAPEVARGEEQGPAADVWALGCMVVEMATGRAPWSGMDGNALAALHRIGYTEAAPEVPEWMSAEAKDFLRGCLVRQASERCTAAQLLDHPFLASAGIVDAKPQAVESKSKWVSPKSTLDAALWESESDTEEAAEHESTAERRMRALACPASALPDWDSDEGWIDVLSGPSEAVPVAAEETAELDDAITPCGEESGVLDAILVQYSSFV